MLANILGMYGRSVTVPRPSTTSSNTRAASGSTTSPSGRSQTVDLVDSVRPPHQSAAHHADGQRRREGDPGQQSADRGFGWGSASTEFIQPEVDRALYEGLSRFDDVRVLFGHQVETVEEDTSRSPRSLTSPDATARSRSTASGPATWWAARAASRRRASAWASPSRVSRRPRDGS